MVGPTRRREAARRVAQRMSTHDFVRTAVVVRDGGWAAMTAEEADYLGVPTDAVAHVYHEGEEVHAWEESQPCSLRSWSWCW